MMKEEEIDLKTEINLLTNFVEYDESEEAKSANEIKNRNYNITISTEMQKLFETNTNFRKVINDSIVTNILTSDVWLTTGVALLMRFIQNNWTGPQEQNEIDWLVEKRTKAIKALSIYGECNNNVKNPELLHFAKEIFSSNIQLSHKSAIWWLFRTNLIHQSIIEEFSDILYQETEELINKIAKIDTFNDLYCKTLFGLEAAQFFLYYRRPQSSVLYLDSALHNAKLQFDMTGAMGIRTRYQVDAKAQLYLDIKMNREKIFPYRVCSDIPKALELNDDLRLERITFADEKETPKLGDLELAILLAKFQQLRMFQPKDKLVVEEIMPYLTHVIDNTTNWSLKMTSLYYQCSLECDHKRTIERAMLQVEALSHEIKQSKAPLQQRIDLFFASGMKPIWAIEELMANLMLNLGMIKSALDVYLKLGLWEEIIVCYNILNLKHKAAEIIQQELLKNPTVKLWCLLGDATGDTKHYETAWELSEEKSSRVQRHWGNHYFLKKQYKEAIPHLKLSGELNYIQENVWMRLGYAALQTEDWELAATAYRNYTSLEQMTFEAWNNLAKAYIKLKYKEKAYMALHDAIKCNYNQWEVWDNLMVVCCSLKYYNEILHCYHQILDLKSQHLDIEVLTIVSNAILNGLHDADGNHTKNLLPKALELFGRITAKVTNNSQVWLLYGQLTALNCTDIDTEKTARYFQNALRSATSDPRWVGREDATKEAINMCCALVEAYLNCSTMHISKVKKIALLNSGRLSIQSTLTKIKNQRWDANDICEQLNLAEQHLNTLNAKFECLRDEPEEVGINVE